jgi:hypothetical protein
LMFSIPLTNGACATSSLGTLAKCTMIAVVSRELLGKGFE